MDRFAIGLSLTGILALVGCGPGTQVAENVPSELAPTGAQVAPNVSSPGALSRSASTLADGVGSGEVTADSNAAGTAGVAGATDVVGQFLDQIRRGGEDSAAHQLLTKKARSELKRIGHGVQPIGSPDAGFQVTRAEPVPGKPNAALVHSVWTEPSGNGPDEQFQVVWAVHREPEGWRISGLAMELDPQEAPMVIDFENGDLMAKLLATPDFEEPADLENPASAGTPSRAAAKSPSVAR